MEDLDVIVIPAVRGINSGDEYYVAMLPLRSAGQFFQVDYFNLPPEERAQRLPDPKRVMEIAQWIIDKPTEHPLPALTSSVEGEMTFVAWEEYPKLGLLKISLGAYRHLLDGQHRNEALRKAVQQKPEFESEAIAVVIFKDLGLEWRQRTFAKINLSGKPPKKSLGQFYDGSPESTFTRKVVEAIPRLFEYTEIEQNNISKKTNNKLLVYNWIHYTNHQIISGKDEDYDLIFCKTFWTVLLTQIKPWQKVFNGEISPNDVLKDYICSHAVTIQALTLIAKELNGSTPETLAKKMSNLKKIDWHKTNPQFQGRVLSPELKMLTKSDNIRLLANYLKSELGLKLTPEDMALEAQYFQKN